MSQQRMNVSKWGGASNSCKKEIDLCKRVLPIDCRVLVVSAPGQCDLHKIKVTDLLIRSLEQYDLIDQVIERFVALMDELGVDLPELVEEMQDVAYRLKSGEITRVEDLASLGERWNAPIIAAYLGGPWKAINSVDVFRFTTDGQLKIKETLQLIRDFCSDGGYYVLGGYFGADETGTVWTGSRGASDFWAALVALALGARECTFWKDVPGVCRRDPKEHDGEQPIGRLTNAEFVSRFVDEHGDGVLHRCAAELLSEKIDIHVANFNTGLTGTVISTPPSFQRLAA